MQLIDGTCLEKLIGDMTKSENRSVLKHLNFALSKKNKNKAIKCRIKNKIQMILYFIVRLTAKTYFIIDFFKKVKSRDGLVFVEEVWKKRGCET